MGKLLPHLELVCLEPNHPVFEPGQPVEHVYFPLSGVISIVAVTQDKRRIEIATVGNEGVVGLPLFLRTQSTPAKAYAQVPGESLRIGARAFKRQIHASQSLARYLRLYTGAWIVQVSQSLVCNRIHTVTQRCARWLLMTQDRVGMSRFLLTQESLGAMLGVRRTGASQVAARLKERGLITYSRGNIHILDRQGLRDLSCECYDAVKQEFDRLFQD